MITDSSYERSDVMNGLDRVRIDVPVIHHLPDFLQTPLPLASPLRFNVRRPNANTDDALHGQGNRQDYRNDHAHLNGHSYPTSTVRMQHHRHYPFAHSHLYSKPSAASSFVKNSLNRLSRLAAAINLPKSLAPAMCRFMSAECTVEWYRYEASTVARPS